MNQYRTNGAIGALLDEYQRAIGELKTLVLSVSTSELVTVVDSETTDEDCRSIQSILIHVLRAGNNYVIAIRKQQEEEIDYVTQEGLQTSADYCLALYMMFASAESLFQDYPQITLEEKEENQKILVSWGQRYDVEQLMEHAIVHILRHRRQIERFLVRLRAA